MARVRRVTMAEVAQRAGVSRSAVSLAFNDPSQLGESTVASVLRVAEEMGYVRDPAARMLRSGRTGSLGILLPQDIDVIMDNPYYTQFFRGLGQVCREEQLTLMLVPPLSGSMAKAIPYAAVDGFAVCGLHVDRGEVKALRARRVPFVLVDSDSFPDVAVVDIDARAAQRSITQYVIAQGHRRLLILAFESAQAGERQEWTGTRARRLEGVFDAADAAGLDRSDVRVVEVPCTRAGGVAGLAEVLDDVAQTGALRPTAVVAFADVIALGAMAEARRRGIEVPRELSVTGFDDIPEAAASQPPLTTVHQAVVSKGRLVGQTLVEAIHSTQPGLAQHRVLAADVVVRGSVARPGRAVS